MNVGNAADDGGDFLPLFFSSYFFLSFSPNSSSLPVPFCLPRPHVPCPMSHVPCSLFRIPYSSRSLLLKKGGGRRAAALCSPRCLRQTRVKHETDARAPESSEPAAMVSIVAQSTVHGCSAD